MYNDEGMGEFAMGADLIVTSPQTLRDIETFQEKMAQKLKDETNVFISRNILLVKKLAQKLVDQREMTGDELKDFVKANHKIAYLDAGSHILPFPPPGKDVAPLHQEEFAFDKAAQVKPVTPP